MENPELIQALTANKLFKDVDISDFKLFSLFVEKQYKAGVTLFYQHDPANSVLLITEGTIKISKTLNNGKQVELSRKIAGDLIGEVSFFTKQDRSATALCVEDTTILEISYNDLESVMAFYPKMKDNIYSNIISTLFKSDEKIAMEIFKSDVIFEMYSTINDQKTKLSVAYMQLKESQDKIMELERKHTAMALAVTANHELNQPLMVLQGNLEMLLHNLSEEIKTPKINKFSDNIFEALNRIHLVLEKLKKVEDVNFIKYADEIDMLSIHKEK